MRYDLHLFVLFIGIGLMTRKLSFKGWFGVVVVIFAWLMFNWLKG